MFALYWEIKLNHVSFVCVNLNIFLARRNLSHTRIRNNFSHKYTILYIVYFIPLYILFLSPSRPKQFQYPSGIHLTKSTVN